MWTAGDGLSRFRLASAAMIDGPKQRAANRRDAWRTAALRAYRASPAGLLAVRQGFVLTTQQAREAGIATRDSRRYVNRGEWTAPRRGVLSVLPRPVGDPPAHGLRPEVLAAAAALVRPHTVISHEFAALAFGLDVLDIPRAATLSTSSRRHSAARGGVVVRAADMHDDEIARWFGVPIMTPARTVIDIARRGMRPGIVVADSALAAEVVTMSELRAALDYARGRDGVITARRVLDLATPSVESPLESLTRLFLATNNVPLPEPQQWIETHRGWYRVDGLWREKRVVLEIDGLKKYRDDEDAFPAEKRREAALDLAGYRVVRVTWFDIHHDRVATLRRIWAAIS